jgi:copper(I)-binding protein
MRILSLIVAAVFAAAPAFAHDNIHIENPYARANGGIGSSGAVFMEIINHADEADRLIGAASDVAEKVELHTHKASADGVMQMMAVPEGFPVEPMMSHALARGGDHIMMMGLKKALKDGDMIHLTLTFEHAGVVEIDVAVDNARKPDPAAMHKMHDAPAAP